MLHINDPYVLYMAEAEGCTQLVNTRTAKLNAIVKEINAKYDNETLPFSLVQRIADQYDLILDSKDIQYISRRI